jgi:hypothetical protein
VGTSGLSVPLLQLLEARIERAQVGGFAQLLDRAADAPIADHRGVQPCRLRAQLLTSGELVDQGLELLAHFEAEVVDAGPAALAAR